LPVNDVVCGAGDDVGAFRPIEEVLGDDRDFVGQVGIVAAAGTPKPIVDLLNTEINKVLNSSVIKEAGPSRASRGCP
jgi:hypothetical protein